MYPLYRMSGKEGTYHFNGVLFLSMKEYQLWYLSFLISS